MDMTFGKKTTLWVFKWYYIVVVYIGLIAAVIIAMFTDIFGTSEQGRLPEIVWLLLAGLFLVTVILILSKIIKSASLLEEISAKLEKNFEATAKEYDALTQINQNIRLAESTKAIAFRDLNIQILREAVFDRLQCHDFEATNRIIDQITQRTGYSELAGQLRKQADKYRDATDQERVNQVITHINKLLDDNSWAMASSQIERLISRYPASEPAKSMRQKLADKKQERKKILLTAWDDAVKRQATDRSLEILKELDQYLSPNEGLALQEAAGDVFRTKLHNLGVQFALAVSEKQWDKALETGRHITNDFPNSRMAREIREMRNVLKQKAQK